jgi:type I restriction enzyme S subunit
MLFMVIHLNQVYLIQKKKGKGLIRIRDLKNNYCGYYTEEETQEKYIINAGDIVAGMDAEFIPSIWLGEQSWLNQRLCKFEPKSNTVSQMFIYYTVKPLLEKSQYGKVGTTVIHLGKSDIDRYEILNTYRKYFKKIQGNKSGSS